MKLILTFFLEKWDKKFQGRSTTWSTNIFCAGHGILKYIYSTFWYSCRLWVKLWLYCMFLKWSQNNNNKCTSKSEKIALENDRKSAGQVRPFQMTTLCFLSCDWQVVPAIGHLSCINLVPFSFECPTKISADVCNAVHTANGNMELHALHVEAQAWAPCRIITGALLNRPHNQHKDFLHLTTYLKTMHCNSTHAKQWIVQMKQQN